MTSFFISGLSRSGTTLLEKLLHSHSSLSVASQPFPYLYRFIKQSFFDLIDYPETYYVLNNLFKEKRYSNIDFVNFLHTFQVSRRDLERVFDDMRSFSGQLTRPTDLQSTLSPFQTSPLADTYLFLIERMAGNGKKITGSKEINCEEFFTYFLASGIKCIQLIRDPRDVITSLNVGAGTRFAGQHRPTLFHVRNWRKSAAFALLLENDPQYLCIRYEDLVLDPKKELDRICSFLKVAPFNEATLSTPLRDQQGGTWVANSSIIPVESEKTISRQSIGYFNSHLDKAMIDFIQHTCWPEMRYFGYLPDNPAPTFQPVKPLKEQFEIKVSDLPADYSSNSLHLDDEYKRIMLYAKASANPKWVESSEARLYYLDQKVLNRLVGKEKKSK